MLGGTGPSYYVTALSVGGIVCIAASNGGTTSQDLKTGFLIGATPRAQQLAILAGAFASAVVLGPILLSLNQSSTVYAPIPAAEAARMPESIAYLTPRPKLFLISRIFDGLRSGAIDAIAGSVVSSSMS